MQKDLSTLKTLQLVWSALLVLPVLLAVSAGPPQALSSQALSSQALYGSLFVGVYFLACVAAIWNFRIGWCFALFVPAIAFSFYTWNCIANVVSLFGMDRENERLGLIVLTIVNAVFLVLPSFVICILSVVHRKRIYSIIRPSRHLSLPAK
jgi:hypothetical protein